ncbi:MAG: mechanosensitive ion channel family protein [Muribaculaceae bacterium]|nr:mechanosensitive ion channel family protein [Muribaculaceae bacterium]
MTETISATARFFSELRIWLTGFFGLGSDSGWISALLLIGVLICSVAGYYLSIMILKLVAVVVEKTETDWDDDLINAPLLRGISLLPPAIIAEWLMPYCFRNPGNFSATLHLIASFYIIGVSIYAVNTFLDNLLYAFSRRHRFKPFAVKGIFQMVKLIIIGIGVIIGLSLIIGKSPIAILTALGASAAILMLVFKDTILGLVASVQLTANKMLHKGDWIIVPKHNANGEVIDISLTTVKIRNWDNSVTTIPPYSLVSESFQNYQAMRRSKARRVCRPIYIDINSVRFLSDNELESLRKNGLLGNDGETAGHPNLRLFREYMERWLQNHPNVRTDLLYMVRQLEPTTSGLPLEFYFFLSEVRWKEFEHLQSDIFDHIYASAPLFGLTIFQSPSGRDIVSRGEYLAG